MTLSPARGAPAARAFDAPAVTDILRNLLQAVGEDPAREGLLDTPGRMARMYQELLEGLFIDAEEVLAVSFEESHDEMVILREIPFYSMCEHHLLPFHGQAHVGYLPAGRIVGLSKLARAVEIFAKRPQVQERLTTQIAESIERVLGARGVGVVIEAEHLCMTARGIRKPGSHMVTSAMRGVFRSDPESRAEFLQLIRAQS
ncbi:MAG: GTP cyclohydrolase I FolE [Chloroflexi bacterium]|nr:GTP cyclohydrolase I FolE [Chloroflexota bacterium]